MKTNSELSKNTKEFTVETNNILLQKGAVHFIRTAPALLCSFLAENGINACFNKEKLDAFLSHDNIHGAQHDFFSIRVCDIDLFINYNHIVTMSCQRNVLFQFIKNFNTIEKICKDLEEGHLKPFATKSKTFRGDLFYSDVDFAVGANLKDNSVEIIAYYLACEYLRSVDFYIHR
jgi:hypothetical protein